MAASNCIAVHMWHSSSSVYHAQALRHEWLFRLSHFFILFLFIKAFSQIEQAFVVMQCGMT